MRFCTGRRTGLAGTALVVLLAGACSDSLQPAADTTVWGFDYSVLPREISTVDLDFHPDSDQNAFLSGDNMVLANYRAFALLDLSQHGAPRKAFEVTWDVRIRGISLLDSSILILDQESLNVLDLLDPEGPPKGTLRFPDGEFAYFMEQIGRSCWVGTQRPNSHALYRIEMQDSTKPQLVAETPIGGTIKDVAVEGNLMLVGTSNGTVFVDITDPGRMETLLTIGLGERVTLGNGYAYVSGSDFGRGITAIDIQDPRHPFPVGSVLTPSGPGRMQVQGRYLFVSNGPGIDVIDILDRRMPLAAGSLMGGPFFHLQEGRIWTIRSRTLREYEFGSSFHAPLVKHRGVFGSWRDFAEWVDGRIFWTSGNKLHSLGVHDPDLGGVVQDYPIQAHLLHQLARVRGDRVYSGLENELRILNLYTGRLLGTLDCGDQIRWIDVHGDILYAITTDEIESSYRLLEVDVARPDAPHLGAVLRVEGTPSTDFRDADLRQGRVLVLREARYREAVLDLLDATNPWQPQLVSTTGVPTAEVLASSADFAYLLGTTMSVVDVRDATRPRVTQTRSMNEYFGWPYTWVVIHGRTLYALDWMEMQIFDLTRPDKPRYVASQGWESTNLCYGVLSDDDFLYPLRENGIYAYPHHMNGSSWTGDEATP